jgi:ribosomal protein S20
MANTRSAAKAARMADRRRDRNRGVKAGIKKIERNFQKLAAASKIDEAKALLPKLNSVYSKAAKSKIVHPSKVARKVSRLTLALRKAAPAA